MRRKQSLPRRLPLLVILLAGLAGSCGPRETRVDIPVGYQNVRDASVEDLVSLVNQRYAGLGTLTVARLRVEFTGGSIEQGYLKEYPTGKGHLLAAAPDSIYLNILNPLTSSTVVAMASTEGRFQIWLPRENKYLIGKTDVRREDEEPISRVRPEHLLNALLIEPIPVDDPGVFYFVREERDAARKYYVFEVVQRPAGSGPACLQRQVWIERSGLTLARQSYFECGRPVSIIEYGSPVPLDSRMVPAHVQMERPGEQYQIVIRLETDAIRVNRELKEGAFDIPQPPNAELVVVEDDPKATAAPR